MPQAQDRSVRVLTVDDQEPFRRAARRLIEATPGFCAAGEAASGEDGVTAAMSGEVDLMLMDVRLPGIDGIEATRRIRAARPDIEVLLVSSAAAQDLPPGASECGALAVRRKDELRPSVLLELWGRVARGAG